MTVYSYISQNNPDGAYEICKKYGYFDVQTLDELSYCLQDIVSTKSEEGLSDVLSIHPEKDVILELYQKKVESEPTSEPIKPLQTTMPTPILPDTSSDCSCNMKNAEGTQVSSVVNQTNTYILVGALIVSIAIISMKKS
jgi:hypothetical protein